MIRRPPRSTQSRSSAASDVYKRQGDYGVLERLRGLAPLTVVAGNTDRPFSALDLPWEVEVEIAGLRVIVCHIGASLMGRHDPVREGFDLVISGHSHKA